jgi:hypothetical protein
MVWWWCGVVVFFTDYNTTPTKVVLSCFGLLVGLWQMDKKGKRVVDTNFVSLQSFFSNIFGFLPVLKA